MVWLLCFSWYVYIVNRHYKKGKKYNILLERLFEKTRGVMYYKRTWRGGASVI